MTVHPSGLLTIDSATYHADILDDTRPSLSKSIIQTIIEKSPAHARIAHPRLNPNYERKEEDKFSVGTIAHSLFLEGDESKLAIAPEIFTDWKKKAAQEMRDEARAFGQIPLLASQAAEVRAMVAALRDQCDSHPEGPFFTDGTAEKALCWEDEYGVLCRARLDWLRDDLSETHDLKTTKASASPYSWDRTMYSIGADVQAAWYVRGCRAVLGCEPEFKFVAVETVPPYAMTVFGLTPEAYQLANKKIDYALKLWAQCLRNDAWPAYPSRVAYVEPPPWHENQWLAKEVKEVAA